MVNRITYTLIFLLIAVCSNASFIINPYILEVEEIESFDFCVRADGTADKVDATGPVTSASGCMGVTTFNASSFSAGEKVLFTSRGGNYTTTATIPSAGTSGNEITYKGEDNYQPNWTSNYVKVAKSYVIISSLKVSSGATSSFEFGDTTNTYVGIETQDLQVYNGGNQAFQHLDGVTVIHNDLYASGATDEGISLHNDDGGVADPIVTVNGATIINCYNGINWVGAPTLSVYDFTISGTNAAGVSIQPANSGGTYIFERGVVTENPSASSTYIIDCSFGTWTFKNIIFQNLYNGSYYMLARSTVSGFDLYNCTFIGDGSNETTAVFNQYAGVYKNNIFLNTVTGSFFGATGTIDYNLFYNSGTARGTNTVLTDPNLDANGKIQSTGSSAYDAGVGPSVDSNVPSVDIDGDTRSGSTCDIGADEYI
jgi:hypothetical protein